MSRERKKPTGLVRFLRKPLNERNNLVVGVVGLLITALIALGAYRADALPFLGGGTGYTAEFSDSAGLRVGDDVRIAGVRVGQVTAVNLDGDRVAVDFEVENAWVGNSSEVAIGIRTLLGAKYLALDPQGPEEQDPGERIPLDRTTTPLDVTQAFQQLGETVGELDTEAIGESFEAISDAFRETSPEVDAVLNGVADLSEVINQRDAELSQLLESADDISAVLADQSDEFERLINDGNLLLEEVRARREAINALFRSTVTLSEQLTGLVQDNQEQIQPTLNSLDQVADVFLENQEQLDEVLATAGPYYRLLGNAVGSGRWLDTYICGLVPEAYVPQAVPDEGCVSPRGGQ
ncbi:MCE family protein [Streptomyces sp. DSM 44917]|uniref:MCE family protein n=1 Tax=Streptomyces boetiae TaxID=3075541 RepID=A0ABU2L9J1_9ACTN|nr:MCE family protein [Streptomyces sp. DSM 44917]MDT0307948.1 MCE family protein [Streptomyces sp. DSM 44917]